MMIHNEPHNLGKPGINTTKITHPTTTSTQFSLLQPTYTSDSQYLSQQPLSFSFDFSRPSAYHPTSMFQPDLYTSTTLLPTKRLSLTTTTSEPYFPDIFSSTDLFSNEFMTSDFLNTSLPLDTTTSSALDIGLLNPQMINEFISTSTSFPSFDSQVLVPDDYIIKSEEPTLSLITYEFPKQELTPPQLGSATEIHEPLTLDSKFMVEKRRESSVDSSQSRKRRTIKHDTPSEDEYDSSVISSDDQSDDEFKPKRKKMKKSVGGVKHTRKNFPSHVVDIFKNWLTTNTEGSYPTIDEKLDMMAKTGLTREQVDNWFINARRRRPEFQQRVKGKKRAEEKVKKSKK